MKLSPHDSSLDALKFVVDMADVPMVITDEDGRFVFANGHTLDIVGKAEDACIGKPLASLLSVSRRPRFNRSGKAPVLFTREGRFYEVDGISRFHAKSDTFELSRIHDVTSTYRDKEMLEFLKSNAPIGIFQFVMDEHFSFFYVSEGFCAMHGYPQDQMKTAPDIRGSELIHPDHLQRFNDLIRAAYEDGKSSVGFEMKVIRRDGKVRWLLTQCSFVKTVDGTIVYGYVSDCTDLKNMEEKTKTVQDVCRFTVNHDYEWILLVDIPADRYEYFFSGRNSMTGSGMQGVFSELVRLRSETVVHPDDVEAYRAFFKPERLEHLMDGEQANGRNDDVEHEGVEQRHHREQYHQADCGGNHSCFHSHASLCFQIPPKRRLRVLYSSMARSRSARVKSGHNTSISTNSA